MKCILLSAGKGERLLPYTLEKPKCLIDIGGTSLIEIWLKKISCMDIDEIIVNTHHLSDILENEILKISYKLNIKNINIYYEKDLLGTAGTLWSLKNKINDDFFVINTDVYADLDLDLMRKAFFDEEVNCLLGFDYRLDTLGCGVINLTKEFFISDFNEKNHSNIPGFVYSGVLIFSRNIFKVLPFANFSKNNFKGLDTGFHVIPKILKTTKGFKIDGSVIDLRDEKKLLELREYLGNKHL